MHGSGALHRSGDGIVLNSESSPFVLGVSSQLSSEHLYVRALETSEIAYVSLDCFNQIVANDDLWQHFAQLLVYTHRGFTNIARRFPRCRPTILFAFSCELMQEPSAIAKAPPPRPISKVVPIFPAADHAHSCRASHRLHHYAAWDFA
jgi:CRP-like cAMP-binding protein